jgi:hypothetical protein
VASRSREWLPIVAVVAVGFVLSFVVTERYHHRVLTLVFLWATMGLAWNIISGYAGQISFGHQAFFGIGAYVTVLLAAKLQLTPWLGMLGGVGVAVLAAVLIGTPTFRLAGIYFGLATLAYPLIFRIVMDYLGYQEVAIPRCASSPVSSSRAPCPERSTCSPSASSPPPSSCLDSSRRRAWAIRCGPSRRTSRRRRRWAWTASAAR